MKNRPYYEKLFEAYPDVVTLPEFREMLGGIGDTTARKLMRGNYVRHFLYSAYISDPEGKRD